MAIKGKRKSRGGSARRISTPPPRPLVVGRTPLTRRRGFRITMLVLLLGIGVLAFFLIRANLRADRAREAAQEDVREFQVRVEAAVTKDGLGQTGFGPPTILTELGTTISQLTSEELKPAEVRDKAKGWSESARAASDAIGALDVGTSESATDLAQAKGLLQQGLLLHSQLARALEIALGVEGPVLESLSTLLSEQLGTAAGVFASGWDRLQQVRAELGIQDAPPPQGGLPPGGFPGGLPPGGVPPGGLPPGVEIPST